MKIMTLKEFFRMIKNSLIYFFRFGMFKWMGVIFALVVVSMPFFLSLLFFSQFGTIYCFLPFFIEISLIIFGQIKYYKK